MAKKNKFIDNSAQAIRMIDERTQKALKDIGRFIEGEAKLRSPVDTGKLRKSIKHQVDGKDKVHIGTDVEYSIYVEMGTSRQKAQPYLMPALTENLTEVFKIIQKHFKW